MKISCGHSKREEIFWGLLKSLMEKGICKIVFRDSGGEKTEDKKSGSFQKMKAAASSYFDMENPER